MKNTFKNMISNNVKKSSLLGNAKKKFALMAVTAGYVSTMMSSTVLAAGGGDTSTITRTADKSQFLRFLSDRIWNASC